MCTNLDYHNILQIKLWSAYLCISISLWAAFSLLWPTIRVTFSINKNELRNSVIDLMEKKKILISEAKEIFCTYNPPFLQAQLSEESGSIRKTVMKSKYQNLHFWYFKFVSQLGTYSYWLIVPYTIYDVKTVHPNGKGTNSNLISLDFTKSQEPRV